MADGMTPEEKLLRIIETPPGEGRRVAPKVSFNFQASGLYVKAWIKHYREKARDSLSLKTAIQGLMVACVLATVFLIVDFWMGLPSSAIIQRLERAAQNTEIGKVSIEGIGPLSLFEQEISQNNIFSLPPPQAPVIQQGPAQPQAVDVLKTMVQSLRVVGILWSDVPQVIIEDTTEGRTHFLNKGSKIKDVRVKEILRDRVILSYDKQEIELR
ncbi:MAG: hypothetical protein WC732_07305 [Candidatus Omnitrophota bacterium]